VSGAIIPFTKSAHQRVFDALPWYLNGSLDDAERALVEQHLPACAACRTELESQRSLQQALARETPLPDPEASLARLIARLDRTPGAVHCGGGIAGWLARRLRPVPAWARLALAAQFAAIATLCVPLMLAAAGRPALQAAPYRALASAALAPRAQGDLIVVFDPQTPLRALQETLSVPGLRIVDGPLASGGYVLQAPPAGLAAALQWLRAQRTVLKAETLDMPGAP
jgi:anti-sigma factor RsiW